MPSFTPPSLTRRSSAVLGILVSLALGEARAEDARLRALEQRLHDLEHALAEARASAEQIRAAAHAVPTVPSVPKAPGPSSSLVKPTPDGGFALVDAERGNELRFSAMVQLDSRLFLEGETATGSKLEDGFLLRRIRPTLSGQFAGLGFRIAPELSGNGTGANVALLDAFVDIPTGRTGFLRVGKQKSAISLDRLRVATALPLVERGLANELAPNRDLGLAWYGQAFSGGAQFVLGLFNGAADGRDVALRDDGGKEVYARVFFEPFRNESSLLNGLGFGVSATAGRKRSEGPGAAASASLPRYRSAAQEEFFAYSSGVVADGHHRRLFPQLSYFHRNAGFVAELGVSEQVLQRESQTRRLRHTAYDVTLSWVPTGQPITFRGVQLTGSESALELGLRASGLRIDPRAFEGGLTRFASPDVAARRAQNLGLGLSWHVNRQVKWSLDVNRTRYQGGAPGGADRQTEDVVMGRFQLVY